MDAIQQIGIDLILWLQQFSPTLDGVMRGLSALGIEILYTLVLTFTYWCVDIHLGMRIAVLLVASNYINTLPSGCFTHHALIGWMVKYKRLRLNPAMAHPPAMRRMQSQSGEESRCGSRAAGCGLPLAYSPWRFRFHASILVSTFLHDVLLGWLLGAIVLIVYLRLEQPVGQWLSAQSLGRQIAVALGISLFMLGLGLLVHAAISGITDPPEWSTQAAAAFPPALDDPAIDPRSLEGLFSMAGTIFGLTVGVALMRRYAPFSTGGVWWKRIVRFVLGLISVIVMQVELAALFPSEPEWIGLALRSVRYAVLMLWAVWLAPWLFLTAGAGRETVTQCLREKGVLRADLCLSLSGLWQPV
jgi:hypothetical protein